MRGKTKLMVGIALAVLEPLCNSYAQDLPTKGEKLVWSDEFSRTNKNGPRPDPDSWTYDIGNNGWGNHEFEMYCAYGSSESPCDPAMPNVFVGSNGLLHIVARQPRPGVYTSARLKSEGLQSFQYGRIEARIKLPAGQGMWPAFWMLGDNIEKVNWPACGEMDIMENIGKEPSINHGSIHGTGFVGDAIGKTYSLPGRQELSHSFHIFGVIWSPRHVAYYVDDPKSIYASFTPADLPKGAVWPFDQGKFFFILNVAVGGDWPGPPDASTQFPEEMLVDYIRVYQMK